MSFLGTPEANRRGTAQIVERHFAMHAGCDGALLPQTAEARARAADRPDIEPLPVQQHPQRCGYRHLENFRRMSVPAPLALIEAQKPAVVFIPIKLENVALMQAGPQGDHQRQSQMRVAVNA